MENKKNTKILGSHNSMSYMEPISKIGKLFRFNIRCQRKTVYEQYHEYGIRLFDLRLYFNEVGRGYFKSGKYMLDTYTIFQHLDFLNKQGDAYVRISLEESHKDHYKYNADFVESRFMSICHTFEIMYPGITFFGGERTYDNTILHLFRSEYSYKLFNNIDFDRNGEYYNSKKSIKHYLYKIIESICPLLYAKIINKKNYSKWEKSDEHQVLLMDFVDIR